MLDDLRKSALQDESDFTEDDQALEAIQERPPERHFLGMRPVERMFLSIFLFMTVAVLMLALLLASGRIVL
jgi:hypothetical protein